MSTSLHKAITLWDVLGLISFAIGIWCVWTFVHTPIYYPGPNVEAGRYFLGFLLATNAMLICFSIRFKKWVFLGLCVLNALLCTWLLLTQL